MEIIGDHRADNRRLRRDQTRTALLEAAERLWAERGIHGASLDDIARTAGMTKGAVYSNFTGKTDLVLALLDRHTQFDLGPDRWKKPHDRDSASEDRFERAGRDYAQCLGGEDARLLALLLVEFWLYGMRDFAAGWRIADGYHTRRGNLSRALTEVDGISTSERAILAMAMEIGLAFQHLLDPERVPAEIYASAMRLVLGRALA